MLGSCLLLPAGGRKIAIPLLSKRKRHKHRSKKRPDPNSAATVVSGFLSVVSTGLGSLYAIFAGSDPTATAGPLSVADFATANTPGGS